MIQNITEKKVLFLPEKYDTLLKKGLNLLRKEIFGMQSDRPAYPILIEEIHRFFCKTFGADMVLINKSEDAVQMGCFWIKYKYLPLGYDIRFAGERGHFDIDIFDGEGAETSLYLIKKFETEVGLENAKNAVRMLKEVLVGNDFCFYIEKGEQGELYQKKGNHYKRIDSVTPLWR